MDGDRQEASEPRAFRKALTAGAFRREGGSGRAAHERGTAEANS